jgi:hypothetical protein
VLVKEDAEALYVFAVSMRDVATEAKFLIAESTGLAKADAIDESRELRIDAGAFADRFEPWQVHLYRIPKASRS